MPIVHNRRCSERRRRKPPIRALTHALLPLVLVMACSAPEAPRFDAGQLDLSSWSFDESGPVDLVGEWEVCWGELVSPSDSGRPDCPSGPWELFPVPRLWSDSGVTTPIGGRGVATYRSTIELPEEGGPLALQVGAPMTAYRLWISGNDEGGAGTVGLSRETTTAKLENRQLRIVSGSGRVELLVQVANFEFRGGGLRRTWQIGLPHQIEATNAYALLRYSAFAIASLVIGLVFLAQFSLRPSDAARGWFGLFAVLVGLRIVPGSTSDLYQLLMGWASFDLLIRLEYLNTALLMFVAGGYLEAKVPGVMPPRLTQILRLSALALVPIHLFGSLEIVLATLAAILVLPTLGMALTIASYGRAWRRGTPDAGVTLAAAVVFAISVVHDVFRTQTGLGAPIELFPYFVVVWIASEAYSLLRSFSRKFATAESLSDELQDANFELQETEEAVVRFVPFALLKTLGKESIRDVRPGDHIRIDMTVMACRLRIDPSCPQDTVFARTSELISEVSRSIEARSGFVSQHLGDELLAVFAADRIGTAVEAAIELSTRARTYSATLQASIATGSVVVGTAGNAEGLSSLVVGEAVALARRLLTSMSATNTSIRMTEDARSRLRDDAAVEVRACGNVDTQDGAVEVYEVVVAEASSV